jgi:drug/metabolite transporter superfamily protein YnfA
MDGVRADIPDAIGACITMVGMGAIMYWPR